MATKTAKVDQLNASEVQPTQNDRITADFGTKQSNTDDWLKISNEKTTTGPMLLEDAFAREKVRSTSNCLGRLLTHNISRYTDSIMKEFQNV